MATLFAHLALRFSTHPENLATEALCYILNRSMAAKQGLQRYLVAAGIMLPPIANIQTQVQSDDQSIPDLVGFDADGQRVFLGEAKFWASLTDNQPCAYLRALPGNVASALVFVAPARRLQYLWNELLRRCRDDGFSLGTQRNLTSEFCTVPVGERATLALVSWRSLLSYLHDALAGESDHEALSDLGQLQGLCARMDEHAFLPLRSEELTGQVGTRVLQFYQLVEAVTQVAVCSKALHQRKE